MPHSNSASLAAADMFKGLQQAHAEVRACLRDMEDVTSRSMPDRLEYTRVRYRISRASMSRRTLFSSICAELSRNASVDEAAIIRQVRDADRSLLSKTGSHVIYWTSDAVAADWRGYCAAALHMGREMAVELELEDGLLFPLLKRRSIKLASPLTRSRAA